LVALYAEPISPLVLGNEAAEKLLFAADHGMPAVFTPGIMSGANAPGTLAGTLAQGLAEGLMGVVLAQLRRPGAPVILGGVITTMDMSTAVFTYGSPELSLLSVAAMDVLRWLELPVFSTAGCSDAKSFDQQAAAESAFSLLLTGLCGAHLIHDVGYLESGLTGSPEMLVASDELIGMVRRMVEGIVIDDDALAADVIDEVGPGGHFLDQEHTLRHFRREFWFPRLMDRQRWEIWREQGGQTLGQRAKALMHDLVRHHQPEPLPEGLLRELRQVVRSADQSIAERAG
jgi:trimethylamine--corrinoid protein Co-methyltransferase